MYYINTVIIHIHLNSLFNTFQVYFQFVSAICFDEKTEVVVVLYIF